MDVEIATTTARLEALAPEWAELWERASNTTPFQHPAWLIPWQRHFADRDAFVVAVRGDGRLAALLPFVQHRERLALMGGGVSDYQDGVFDESSAAPALDSALKTLSHCRVARIDLDRLPGFSRWVETKPWTPATEADEVCPVLRLDSQGVAASIPPHQTANIRYYHRRAERLGEVEFACADASNVDAFLDDLFRLHAAAWRARGGRGVLADPAVERFHRAAAPRLLAAGLLRLYRLRVGATAAAVLYGFADRRRTYYYLGGFEPRLRDISPGALILGHAIERAIAEGEEAFDFLRGGERYKYFWGAEDRPTFRRSFRRARQTEAAA